MLYFLEHAAIGAVLIALASIVLARAAVYFRRTQSTGDRFFSTSMISVLVVALAVGGACYLGDAAFKADGVAGIAVAVASFAYLVVVPTVAWRVFGPRAEVLAVPVAA